MKFAGTVVVAIIVCAFPKLPKDANPSTFKFPLQETCPNEDEKSVSNPPLALTCPLELISLVVFIFALNSPTTKCKNEPVPEADISLLQEIYPNEPVALGASTPPTNEPVPLALTEPLISPLT